MNRATLVLPESIAYEIRDSAHAAQESAALLLVGTARTSAGLRLVGRELLWVDPSMYEARTATRMAIPSSAYIAGLARAADIQASALFVHTHPGGSASAHPSEQDALVDAQIAETFRIRTGSDIYASLVFSRSGDIFAFTGRGIDGETDFCVDRVVLSGTRLGLLSSADAESLTPLAPMFSRNVRAFGGAVQRALSSMRIGVVGCGGTGSAVAEQLVRLGVRSLVLVDADVLSESNITRVYGSTPDDVGLPKTRVLSEHLRRIAPSSDFLVQNDFVTSESVARSLTACDVLFGCTDDNAGRLVLSRLAAYYLVPLIDCGVLISTDEDLIRGIDGRVTVQTPGAPCLTCRRRVDLARAAAEQLTPIERRLRETEGYAPRLGRIEPAVVTFTTAVASQAVTELLERLIGFGSATVPSEILLRFHDREISTNIRAPRDGHYCDPRTGKLGVADAEPFLGQLWRS